MIEANIDTPWIFATNEDGDEVYQPKLGIDFPNRYISMGDKTGNYPKGYPVGGGDPDYLMVSILTEDENLLAEIDALPEYYVYASAQVMASGEPVDESWNARYRYIVGTGNYIPEPGELYYRTNQDILRISKESLDGDVSALLDTLTEFNRVSVGVEEYFELRGQVRDRPSYIAWDIANMQTGQGGATLPEGIHTFNFMPNDQKRHPNKNPPKSDWDALRAKLNGRGYPPGWVDRNLGTVRSRPRAEHEENVRLGYATDRA